VLAIIVCCHVLSAVHSQGTWHNNEGTGCSTLDLVIRGLDHMLLQTGGADSWLLRSLSPDAQQQLPPCLLQDKLHSPQLIQVYAGGRPPLQHGSSGLPLLECELVWDTNLYLVARCPAVRGVSRPAVKHEAAGRER
jgi:hypothetical protein